MECAIRCTGAAVNPARQPKPGPRPSASPPAHPPARRRPADRIGLGWTGLDWIGLDWIASAQVDAGPVVSLVPRRRRMSTDVLPSTLLLPLPPLPPFARRAHRIKLGSKLQGPAGRWVRDGCMIRHSRLCPARHGAARSEAARSPRSSTRGVTSSPAAIPLHSTASAQAGAQAHTERVQIPSRVLASGTAWLQIWPAPTLQEQQGTLQHPARTVIQFMSYGSPKSRRTRQ